MISDAPPSQMLSQQIATQVDFALDKLQGMHSNNPIFLHDTNLASEPTQTPRTPSQLATQLLLPSQSLMISLRASLHAKATPRV